MADNILDRFKDIIEEDKENIINKITAELFN